MSQSDRDVINALAGFAVGNIPGVLGALSPCSV